MVTPSWEFRPGAGAALVHVSSTESRIGELLSGLVPAQAATGLSVGWAVVDGDADFHAFNRFVHHLLHGRATAMTTDQLAVTAPHYRKTLAPQASWLAERLSPGSVVVLHNAPTLGMAPRLAHAGLTVVWHCHVGTTDEQASGPLAVWHAFATELSTVDKALTTLPEFAPQVVRPARRRVVAPAVDPYSDRNRELSADELAELLGELPDDWRIVLQVGQWDAQSDMAGLLRCLPELPPDVHLVLAGPDGQDDLDDVRCQQERMAPDDHDRVHLVELDGRDSLLVNALQRRADVVVQTNPAEGVTDAMVKGCAIVATNVGGLREQISPGHNGLLVKKHDHEALVTALRTLLDDPLLRRQLGRHAAESARRRYLIPRLVADYERLVTGELRTRTREAA
jgi:trehalose synthase